MMPRTEKQAGVHKHTILLTIQHVLCKCDAQHSNSQTNTVSLTHDSWMNDDIRVFVLVIDMIQSEEHSHLILA